MPFLEQAHNFCRNSAESLFVPRVSTSFSMPVTLLLMRKICKEIRSAKVVNRLSSSMSGIREQEQVVGSVGAHTAVTSVELTSIRQSHLI